MTYYFVARISIHDHKEYQKYLDEFDDIFSRYNGEFLAIDENPYILEGSWSCTKSVVIKFPGKEDFNNWYYSPEYQRILKFRLNAAKCDTILLEGID